MTDDRTTRDERSAEGSGRVPLPADYGDATPEQVALALLRYRPKRVRDKES